MTAETTIEENKQIARHIPEEVISKENLDVIDEIFAEGVIDHTPLGETHGREAVKELTEYLHAAFADVSATVEDVIAEDDRVVLRLLLRATHDGEFMGVEPTGREVEFENVVFFRIADGQIAERWVRPDTFSLMQQFGVVEPPGE